MYTINSVVSTHIIPTQPDFYWASNAPEPSWSIGESHYPYHHQADESTRSSDARYKVSSSFINSDLIFDAIDSKTEGHPKTITPPKVTVAEFIWDFGDGNFAFGPVVSHSYKVADPNTYITLIVYDSRGYKYTCRKSLGLVYATIGAVSVFKVRN